MPKRKATGDDKSQETRDTASKQSGELINNLNALSANDFQQQYLKPARLAPPTTEALEGPQVEISFKASGDLTKDELSQCLNLIASTSRQHYESSGWGWHPRRKTREMKEAEMRYLLVRSTVSTAPSGSEPVEEADIEGFLSFMLTHDSSPPVPVLYVYEVHLVPRLRKLGLGAHLMRVVEEVAKDAGVEKVMLTCFVCNERARKFYESRGYGKDVISPEDRRTRAKIVKADYVIMSREAA
ncbi:hypothetical protein LTR09_000904 [Extremus antarcticus]|uniref:N-alpha-acetyltransferase 40 n=1 Tax=Extremus antarcticus TaxID=702011 RepID=A0AAJ0LWD6_9PEZI|nr:hypothetical protein LTR09_000904 [Extremus antarcticus]